MPKFNPYLWIREFPAVDRLWGHHDPSYKSYFKIIKKRELFIYTVKHSTQSIK